MADNSAFFEQVSTVGPIGPTGPTGPQGAASTVTGPLGPTGPTGPQGAASTVMGPTGPTGPSSSNRIVSVTSATTITINADITDFYIVTALAANVTFSAPTGTPTDRQNLLIRMIDNGTTRTITWNGIFVNLCSTLPFATTPNKYMYIGFIYNAQSSKWDCMASGIQP